jgi:hypothetical protein
MDAALAEGANVITRVLAAADQALLGAAAATMDRSERQRLQAARDHLLREQASLASSFESALRAEFQGATSPAEATSRAFSFESLELMAEDEVDDTVEFLRMQQQVAGAVESDLPPLNALVSASRGRRIVRAAENPFRPESWVRALRTCSHRPGVPAPVRAAWMQHLGPALGRELAAVYRVLSLRLRQEGVASAAFSVLPEDEMPRAHASPVARTLTARDLKRLLASASGQPVSLPGATLPGVGATVQGMTLPASFEAIQDMKQVHQVAERMLARFRAGVWNAEAVTRRDATPGGADTYTPVQTLARDVVRLMIENIAADRRLLAEVRNAARELEPALLRLVVHDPRFFSDRQHPARQLLGELTQRSQAWSSPMEPGFAEFMQPLLEGVRSLASLPLTDAEPFDFTLAALRQAWGEAEERTRRMRTSAARALLRADARNHAAQQVAETLARRPDVAAAPLELRRFLAGPWAQVMAAASLEQPGTPDPGGYGELVNDLVWAWQPRLTAQNPARLAQLLEFLVPRLRQGLASIGYPQAQARTFFDRLAHAQQEVLGAGASLPGDTPAQEAAAPEAGPWLSPEEAREAGLVGDDETTGFAETVKDPVDPVDTPHGLPGELSELQPGCLVEVKSQGHWVRWRLNWVSPHRMLFMFVDGSGRSESMTRQLLQRLDGLGALRVLPALGVVESALDAVAHTALQNSARDAG